MHAIFTLAMVVLCVCFSAAQTSDWQCLTTDTTSDPLSRIQPMINVTQPLIIILVDFPDGRIQPGNIIPAVDADTIHFPGDSIDAVGGMGWVKTGPNPNDPYRKKIRKYVYEDYWNMIFSAGEYTGTVHPDYVSHLGYVPPEYQSEQPWNLTVYGSLYDYWNEVSNHNLQVQAYRTRAGGSGKYYSGIVNKIDQAGGRNYVRWIMMPSQKSFYNAESIVEAAIAEVRRLHNVVPVGDPDHLEFRIDDYLLTTNGKIGVISAGGALGRTFRGSLLCRRTIQIPSTQRQQSTSIFPPQVM